MEPPNTDKKQDFILDELMSPDQLPLEVREEIISYLPSIDRKNVRLVCNSLYEACSRNEHVRIWNANQWEEFENCRLNHMNVTIDSTVENSSCLPPETWNPVVWKKVGARIRTLHMKTVCTLEDRTLKNIITYCENFRTFRLTLKCRNPDEPCFSPIMLEKVDVGQNNLEVLIIQREGSNKQNSPWSHHTWTNMFVALLGIFPTVRHITSGWSIHDSNLPLFSFSCSLEPDFTDLSKLSSGLAFMLSGEVADWSRALDVCSTLRFSAVTLVYSGYGIDWLLSIREHLRTATSEFFRKQKALASSKVKRDSCVNFIANRGHEFERSVIQRIARHWDSLCELGLDRIGCSSRQIESIYCRSRIELPNLDSKSSNADEAFLDIDISRGHHPSLYLTWKHEPGVLDIYPRDFLKRHQFIQELILTTDVSDKILETIFQFMINLESFSVRLGRHNTRFALVGSARISSDGSIVKGYSIKCLQKLKSLWVISDDGFSFDDGTFDEFCFPELCELACSAPKELVTLRKLILRLPALRMFTIYNMHQEVASFLDIICPLMRDKYIGIGFPNITERLMELFMSHPSLVSLQSANGYTVF